MAIHFYKRLLKVASIASLTVALVLLLSIIFMSSKPGEELIRRFITQHLNIWLGSKVSFGQFETNLFSRAQVYDVKLFYPDGTQFLGLEYGRINYRIWDILTRDPSIGVVYIDSLFITAERDSTGRLVLPIPSSHETHSVRDTSMSFQLRVRNVNVRHATILYDDRLIPLQGAIFGIDAWCEQHDTESYHFQVSSDSARLVIKDKILPVTQMRASGSLSPHHWEVQSLEINLPELVFSGKVSGEMEGAASTLRGKFSLKGSIDRVAGIFNDEMPQFLSPVRSDIEAKIELGGKLAKPQFAVELQITDSQLGEIPITQAQIRTKWMDSHFTLEKFEMTMMNGRISGDGSVEMDSLLNHRLSLSLEGIEFSDLWKAIHQDTVYPEGMIEGEWVSSGPITSLDEVRIESHLYLTQVRYQTKMLPDLNVIISFTPESGSFFLAQEENRFEWKRENTNGRKGGVYRFDIPRIGYLADVLNIQDITGTIRGEGLMKGIIDDPEIVMEIWGENIRYQHFPMDSLYVSAIYKDGRLFVENSQFSGQRSLADTLRPIFQFPGYRGGFVYRGWMSGSIINPEGEVEVHFYEPGFGDFQWDGGDLHLTLSNAQLHLDALTLRKDSTLVKAIGSYRIPSAEGRFDVSVSRESLVKNRSETVMESRLDQSFDSSRFGLMTVYFDKESEENWRIHAKGMGIRLDKMIEFYRDMSPWKGTFDFEFTFTGDKKRPRGSLEFWADSLGMGQVYIDSARGMLELQDDRLLITPLEFYMQGRKSWAVADFDLVKTPSDEYTLSRESEIRGRAEGNGIDIRFLTPFLGLGIEVSGMSEYEIEWKGRWGRPQIRGYLDITDGRIQFRHDAYPIEVMKATFSLADSVFQVGPVSGSIRDIPFHLEGRAIGIGWQNFLMNTRLTVSDVEVLTLGGSRIADSLDFHIDIHDLNLSLFQDFFTDVRRFDGLFSSRMTISGLTKAPLLSGHLEARNVALHPNVLDKPLSDGLIKAAFKNDQISLDTLFFKMNGGRILAGGHINYSMGEMTDLDAWLAVDKVKINRLKKYNLLIRSGRVDLKKERDYYIIGGDIHLGESRLFQDFPPKTLLPFFQKVERPMSMPPSFFRKTRMDVRLRESDKIWIDNTIARIRLHSELGLIGTLAQPNLSGRLSVEEGYVLYLDRKFQVKQGVLDFIDPHRINPVVDFNAQADIKGYQTWSRQPYTVSLNIQGSLDHAVTELTSSPPLDRPDIVTLLTVGATREQMLAKENGGRSSLGNVLEDRVGHLSTWQVSGFAGGHLGNLLNLEKMSIDGNLFRFGKSWGPQLLASKKITDRMEISYTTRVGHANEQSIRLDYRLSKILSLEGQTDQQGQSGLDLKFRWKIK